MLRSAIKRWTLKGLTKLPLSGRPSFTENWAPHIYDGKWQLLFAPLVGKAGLKYLEIGVFEGRSLFWMLENVLTHSTARAVGIDWGATKRTKLMLNLARLPQSHKITLIDDRSDVALHDMEVSSFDIIYIDGGHDVRSVLVDAIYSWRLLRPGGMMIFDDYLLGRGRFPVDLTPKPAVDVFLAGFSAELEVLHCGDQVVVKKRETPVVRYHSETCFGRYVYEWYSGRLFFVEEAFPDLRSEKNDWSLSPEEQGALESALRESPNGAEALYGCIGDDDYPLLVKLGRRLRVPVRERVDL